MNKAIAFLGLAILFSALVVCAMDLRPFGSPVSRDMDDYFLHNGQRDTGANNIVTTVVFDYRGFDTLGEATVLFSAVSGVLVVFRRTFKSGKREKGRFLMGEMSSVVRTQANLILPIIGTFGFYVIVHGHLTPGGGFQGGAVVASGLALMLVSYGYMRIKTSVKHSNLGVYEALGLMTFILLAYIGLGHTFFYNFLANSGFIFGDSVKYGINPGNLNTGGTLPLMSIAVGTEVIAGLSLILMFMYSALRSKDISPNKEVNE